MFLEGRGRGRDGDGTGTGRGRDGDGDGDGTGTGRGRDGTGTGRDGSGGRLRGLGGWGSRATPGPPASFIYYEIFYHYHSTRGSFWALFDTYEIMPVIGCWLVDLKFETNVNTKCSFSELDTEWNIYFSFVREVPSRVPRQLHSCGLLDCQEWRPCWSWCSKGTRRGRNSPISTTCTNNTCHQKSLDSTHDYFAKWELCSEELIHTKICFKYIFIYLSFIIIIILIST